MKGNFHVRLFEGLELVTVSAYLAKCAKRIIFSLKHMGKGTYALS
jgi:hypothetical protein